MTSSDYVLTERNKNRRYRAKCVAEGRCPHCGKPCAPFYECSERRFNQKVRRALRGLEAAGAVRIERTAGKANLIFGTGMANTVVSYNIKPSDRRYLPRIAMRPVDEDQMGEVLTEILIEHGPLRCHGTRRGDDRGGLWEGPP
jgi:hypothetical protein